MSSSVSVEEWVARFKAIGLDQVAMDKWHHLFEGENPAGHQAFLEWLGIPSEKIGEIRRKSA